MGDLRYLGSAPADPTDLATQGYLASLLAKNIPQTKVDALIASGLAPYATKDYVDSKDALNATPQFIQDQDATRLQLSQIGAPNGIAALDETGHVDPAGVHLVSTQRFPSQFDAPNAYNTGSVTATTTPQQLFPAYVTDPGFSYRLLICGAVQASTTKTGTTPKIAVRAGSQTGFVLASGLGFAQSYSGSTVASFHPGQTHQYPIPQWAAKVVVGAIGGGGGGNHGYFTPGQGGEGASWAEGTLTQMAGETLTIIAGTGGAGGYSTVFGSLVNGADGNVSTVAAPNISTMTAPGGTGGTHYLNPIGTAAGDFSYGGFYHSGGRAQTTYGGDGHPPGGGGAGGPGPGNGGNGGDGIVYVHVVPDPDIPSGAVVISPADFATQPVLTGDTTVYVMLSSSNSSSVTALPDPPGLSIIPIPA